MFFFMKIDVSGFVYFGSVYSKPDVTVKLDCEEIGLMIMFPRILFEWVVFSWSVFW